MPSMCQTRIDYQRDINLINHVVEYSCHEQ